METAKSNLNPDKNFNLLAALSRSKIIEVISAYAGVSIGSVL